MWWDVLYLGQPLPQEGQWKVPDGKSLAALPSEDSGPQWMLSSPVICL